MRMRVQEHGDEVHVELRGVAGRQQHVLQAICDYRTATWGPTAEVERAHLSVRAAADDMWIRLAGGNGLRHDARSVYRCLRKALLERAGKLAGAPVSAA